MPLLHYQFAMFGRDKFRCIVLFPDTIARVEPCQPSTGFKRLLTFTVSGDCYFKKFCH